MAGLCCNDLGLNSSTRLHRRAKRPAESQTPETAQPASASLWRACRGYLLVAAVIARLDVRSWDGSSRHRVCRRRFQRHGSTISSRAGIPDGLTHLALIHQANGQSLHLLHASGPRHGIAILRRCNPRNPNKHSGLPMFALPADKELPSDSRQPNRCIRRPV